ncbi:hypothetical protein CMV_028299 [Castanea mollissima]|uniref:DUF4216 domain-containing protein n=1 Tax=Castanea mollissima TaxID=60419 RepID=A0A8J4QGI4_9ROSI|nr:hypothetical protein CMV_028299 [Castanea mollissima]
MGLGSGSRAIVEAEIGTPQYVIPSGSSDLDSKTGLATIYDTRVGSCPSTNSVRESGSCCSCYISGTTIVNTSRKLETVEPFVLACQAAQVYYVNGIKDPTWNVVIETKPRNLYEMPSDKEEPYQEEENLHYNANVLQEENEDDDIDWSRSGVDNMIIENLVTDKLAPVPFCCYSHISCCGGYCKCFCSALVKSNAADKNWITCATTTQRWEFCSEVWISVFVGIARNSSSLADPYSSCLASSRCIMV